MVTFTEDHEIYSELHHKTVLKVAKGDRFLLTNHPFTPVIVVHREGAAVELELDAAGLTRIESPCLDEGADLSSAMVAIADLDVYADDSFEQKVCKIEQYERADTDVLGYSFDGYSAELGGVVYEIMFDGAFCGDLATGLVLTKEIVLGDVGYVDIPIHELFWLRE